MLTMTRPYTVRDLRIFARNLLQACLEGTWHRLVQKYEKISFFLRKRRTISDLFEGLWLVETRFRR